MFKILLPTDFSANAESAIDFVLEHFHKSKISIVLIHTIKAPNSAAGVLIRIDDLMRKDAEQEMRRLQAYISDKHQVESEAIIKAGDLNEWVNSSASKHHIDLIAMGTKGENNIESKIFGSVTESIIRTSKIPVLAVPYGSDKSAIEHVAIATAENHLEKESFLEEFFKCINMSNARINAIKVLQDLNETSPKRISLNGNQINVETINNASIAEGINYYIDTVPTDLLIIYHARNSKIDYFFNRSITKNICAKTDVPLLVIHSN